MSVTYEGEKSGLMLLGQYEYESLRKNHKAYCHAGLFIAFEEPADVLKFRGHNICK